MDAQDVALLTPQSCNQIVLGTVLALVLSNEPENMGSRAEPVQRVILRVRRGLGGL